MNMLTIHRAVARRPVRPDARGAARFLRTAGEQAHAHDVVSKAAVAEWLAELLGVEYDGALDLAPMLPARRGRSGRNTYWIPSGTLAARDAARLGIRDEDDLYGGVVPRAFVATKLITHGLVGRDAAAPAGWCHRHGRRIAPVVLPGWSAFAIADARAGAARLLRHGAVRVKAGDGVGGRSQAVVATLDEFDALVRAWPARRIARTGIVVECNLCDVTTFSVGQVKAGAWTVAYVGTQSLTRDASGHEVYGGSTLNVVRGALDALPKLDLTPETRIAVEQARAYHREAFDAYPGLMASRANYDIAQGRDGRGIWRSGVLEQSWRIGGASGAEVAALHAFKADPSLDRVCASTAEVYGVEGALPAAPSHAQVLYDGAGPNGERLLKYAEVVPAHVHA